MVWRASNKEGVSHQDSRTWTSHRVPRRNPQIRRDFDFAAGAEFEKATVVAVMVVLLVVAAALLARIFGGNVGVRE
ncbi:MAG TPA: hypothetical protein VNA17_00960 [Pyrinomonadaceae bacterium]|nr:hypothetical protein [Pyrinomonadaceae bacterium]